MVKHTISQISATNFVRLILVPNNVPKIHVRDLPHLIRFSSVPKSNQTKLLFFQPPRIRQTQLKNETKNNLKGRKERKEGGEAMSTRGGLLDLEKHFAFYGAYHSNPTNVFIHTLFVWPIFFSALLLFYFTPPLFPLPPSVASSLPGFLVLNFGFAVALLYALFYALLDVKAGSLAAALCMLCWVGSSVLGRAVGYSLAWKVVLASQVLCWGMQFIGHGAFERRAPALLDNLVQALVMAPFFVLLEVLQKLFDYEPYPGFQANVRNKIAADIKEWKASKQKKRA